jgi:small redox-active disulfide protein 2
MKIMTIKILGSGCKNCVTLAENTKTALSELGLQAEMIKVTDFSEIAQYGIMSTPGLVIDEKVVSFGKVLKPKEIIKLLEKIAK